MQVPQSQRTLSLCLLPRKGSNSHEVQNCRRDCALTNIWYVCAVPYAYLFLSCIQCLQINVYCTRASEEAFDRGPRAGPHWPKPSGRSPARPLLVPRDCGNAGRPKSQGRRRSIGCWLKMPPARRQALAHPTDYLIAFILQQALDIPPQPHTLRRTHFLSHTNARNPLQNLACLPSRWLAGWLACLPGRIHHCKEIGTERHLRGGGLPLRPLVV